MCELIKVLAKLEWTCRIVWPSGTEITALVDSLAEVPNGLEENEPSYMEYWIACVKVTGTDVPGPEQYIQIGTLIEVSDLVKPAAVYSMEGRLLWRDTGIVAPDQFDVVRLADGQEGTVVEIYVTTGLPTGFEVEVSAEGGEWELRTVTFGQLAKIIWET